MQPNLPTLQSLLKRVEEADGPDKALAREIQCKIGGWHRVTPSQRGGKHGAYIAPQDWIGRYSNGSPILDSLHGTEMHRDVPDITSSIEAGIALLKYVLPGALWSVGFMEMGPFSQVIRPMPCGGYINGMETAKAATPPLALCAAILRSLISQQESADA